MVCFSRLRHRHVAAAAATAAVVLLFTLHESLLFRPLGVELPELAENSSACTSNVTILGTFALTNDMPCTALFELTFGSLMINVPELRPCPKIFVFEGTQGPKGKEMDQKRYEDFFDNLQMLGISNLKMFKLSNHSTLIESVRYGLSHVTTGLIFLWQPDLMLRRRPKDWSKLVQKLLEDDLEPNRPDALRDVHFRYHHDWDTFLHGPRKRWASNEPSGFQEELYIVNYCDQIQLATTSFYRDHVFRLIDLKYQSIPKEEWGWASRYMEGNDDVLSANHTSVGYGSCYKAHCDKDKRKQMKGKWGYWKYWFYVYPSDLLSDISHAYERTRPCRQWQVQLCLPWAPAWFVPKALGCSLPDHLALYGRLDVLLYTLLYTGAGFVPAWAALRGRNVRMTTQVLLLFVASFLPWALATFIWEYGQGHICFTPPHFRCAKS